MQSNSVPASTKNPSSNVNTDLGSALETNDSNRGTGSSSASILTSSESTPRTSAEALLPLLIFPKDSASHGEKDVFEAKLIEIVGGKDNVDSMVDTETGVVIWIVPFVPSQVALFKAHPIIDTAFQDRFLKVEGFEDLSAEDDGDD